MTTPPVPHFTEANTTAAYRLHYHFAWYTHGRRPSFADPHARTVAETSFTEVAETHNYHVLEFEIEPVAVRALLSLTPDQAPSEVTRRIKGTLAAAIRERAGLRKLWSRGWFFRSVGRCTNDVVRSYVAGQFEHHRAMPVEHPELVALAGFHSDEDAGLLRESAHGVFEYNVHFVLVTAGRQEFLDPYVAQELVEYWKRVCEKKGWIAWDAEVVWDHAHLFLGLRPTDSPRDVALSLMNNAAWFLERKHGAALRQEGLPGVWQPGFYAGTAGSATTPQVKAYLREGRRREAGGEAPPA